MRKTLNNERGAVLIVGLVILIVLSLLGITSMKTSTLEERMAYNMSQRQIAFQAAESALREAEERLGTNSAAEPDFDIAPAAIGAPPNWEVDATWTSADAYTGGAAILGPGGVALPTQPRYIVEEVDVWDVSDVDDPVARYMRMYRITARGLAMNNNIEVMLQTTHLLVP